MRLAEAIGIAELLARVKVRWYPWTLRSLARSIGQRLIEWADAADERASHAGPNVVIRLGKITRATRCELTGRHG